MTRPSAAVALFAGLALAFVLLRPPLPVDETRYLAVAWEMRGTGSWLVPRLNGEIYGHKPPLLFWLINAAWALAGVGDLAARLVAPAFAALAVWLTARLARDLWPDQPRRAGLAALILATTGAFLFFGSATMFDAPLAAGVLAALLGLWRLAREGRRRWALLLGAGLALGAYAKGPAVLLHVAPVALLLPLWRPDGAPLPYGRHLRALGLALLVALGLLGLWLLPALLLGGPAYREEVLWTQSAGRVVAAFDHGRPAWWFLANLPLLLWPWGWSPAALRTLAPARLRADPGARFAATWALSALLAFSLVSGKQTHYLLPELPALALLLSGLGPEGARAWRLAALLPALLLLALGAALALGLTPLAQRPGFALPPWAPLLALLPVAALALALRRLPPGPAAWALVAPLTLLALHLLMAPILARAYDAAPVARLLAPHQGRGLAIREREYHGQWHFAGRLRAPVAALPDDAALAAWAAEHPGGVVVAPRPIEGTALALLARAPFRGRTAFLYQVPEPAP